ncbi:transcriptional regulator [Trinickia terrae]|uniref:Transcriptional regulator n=1 Tax=Trinickia terrae TaxID=2571161 RepID=A0A4U1HIC9_9BURK|nr:helix-turn-helix domain-containing protein [Trinickia terrae]TKC79277.1 transcriptional regulator [Trinickia terrae]
MTSGSHDDSGELDPGMAALLAQLHEASRAAGAKAWSLAKLSKRSALPMSTLRRLLVQLQAAGLVKMTIDDDGTGSAVLTDEGRHLCAALFGG